MTLPPDVLFRLSAQRALLSHVTPTLRHVSLSVDSLARRWAIQFVFDEQPSDSQLDAAHCAVTLVLSDFPDWEYTDEFLFVPVPGEFQSLELPVYARCEDSWVSAET